MVALGALGPGFARQFGQDPADKGGKKARVDNASTKGRLIQHKIPGAPQLTRVERFRDLDQGCILHPTPAGQGLVNAMQCDNRK